MIQDMRNNIAKHITTLSLFTQKGGSLQAKRQGRGFLCNSSLRLAVTLLLMMVVGVNTVWGQINIDFSGKYCIANKNGYNSSAPESNFYLVPATNSNYNSDSNKPHLTTTKSGKVSTSYWTIKKSGDYYHIIYADGRYLTANNSYSGTSGNDQRRLRVHLEQMSSPDNNTLFIILPNKNGGFNIKHKDITQDIYLDPAGGNIEGTDITNARTMTASNVKVNVGGGIGYWSDEPAARWEFEDIVKRPIVSINSDGKAVISSSDASATFYYTIDGTTTPTTGSTQYTSPIDITGIETIKAIAVVNGESSNVATYTVGTGMPYLIQNQECTDYYLVSGDPTAANVPANTSSIAGQKMEWLLKYAGNVNGIQYYYFVNNATKDYLYRTGDNIYVKAFANNDDGYKFNFFTKNSDDSYNLYAKDETSKSLYKDGGNVISNNVKLNAALTNDLAHWKFISTSAVIDKRTLFEASPVAASNYYKIASLGASGSYIISPVESGGTEYAGVSTTETNDNMVWMFEEAGHDEWQTYYNIVSATTGKYMYFAGSATSTDKQANAIEMKDNLTDNERYQFVLARATTADYYYIIPKTHKDVFKSNQYHGVWYDDANTNILKTTSSRSSTANNVKWKFENAPSTFVAPPMVTFDPENMKVYMESSTQDITKIQYGLTKDSEAAPTTATRDYPSGGIDVKYGPVYHFIAKTVKGGNESILTPVKDIDLSYIETPTIEVNTSTRKVTFSTSQKGLTFYYTTDYSDTPSYEDKDTHTGVAIAAVETGDAYKATIDLSEGLHTIRVIAVSIMDDANKTGYSSSVASKTSDFREVTTITSLDEIDNKNGIYRLSGTSTITGTPSVGTSADNAFEGVLDGDFKEISLSAPLFKYVKDATIKNVIISNANSISGSGNMGAICQEASGTTRIYNCGVLNGSITSNDAAAGGLVGHIASGSSVRVVNCYNYATVSGTTYAAGIVGWNEGAIDGTTTVSGTGVRIANCMMYGKITNGNNRSPVYCGNHTNNQQKLTEYNFWRSQAYTSNETAYTVYNDQLAIGKDDYLNRFPFYRHILNTHRELAAYFLFADNNEEHVSEIGHWALNTDKAPYPIVERWETNTKRTIEDIAANLPNTTEKFAGKLLNNISSDGYYRGNGTQVTAMGTNGMLAVTVKIGSKTFNTSLPITDMNTLRYDYTWGKVVLPHANEFSGWARDYDYVCTGWKVTSVTQDGSSLTTFNIPSSEPYNFADRNNAQKDIYNDSSNPYVFAQGGNYIVPYGVTAITIEAHFAKAFYLSDPYADVGYKEDYTDGTNLGWQVPTTYHGKTVYTNLNTLVGELDNATNPNDQAIVLVGNFHHRVTAANNVYLNTAKAVTIMSCDEDNNQEPDYAWYMGNTFGRMELPPIRFDAPNIEVGMAARVNSSSGYPGVGIWHVHGWFELTENSLNNSSQFEINSQLCNSADDGNGNNRWIANSGCFVQVVRSRQGNCNQLSYMQVGGNAYIKELYPGSHTDNGNTTTSVPIMVSGGQVDECFMTGYTSRGGDNKSGTLSGDMIYFWSAGGEIRRFLGAYLEEPTSAGLTAKIDHARIGRFFGGGTSAAARIKGDIDITINNSKVDFYCGGPEFGDMYEGKTLATHAIGTTFGEYYGAGFGGTSITYVRKAQTNKLTIENSKTYDLAFTNYTNNRLKKDNTYGIGTCYKFEFIFNSNATQLVTRFYTGYAQFSLATTGNVTNTLSHCVIENDFYGAGCQGKVNGTVTSTLTNCEVKGSAFGGGYKAESNELGVYPTTQPTYAVFTKETGLFSDFGTVEPETYTWVQGNSTNKNTVVSDKTQIYTDVNMSDLGNVTDAITLTIDGGSVTNNVFGGGNESKSLNNTTVNIQNGVNIGKSVYGGGNLADVNGNTEVNVTGGTIGVSGSGGAEYGNVYGGGKGKEGDAEAGLVKGNTNVTISGMPTIYHNIYGGGAYGSVGTFSYDASGMPTALATEETGVCNVTITGGTIGSNGDENGMVFGSSRGDVATPVGTPAVDPNDHTAWVYSTHVTIGDSEVETRPVINGSVYGSGENGHTFHNTIVDIKKGIVGITTGNAITDKNGTPDDTSDDTTYSGADYPYRGNVYGGGCGTDKYDSDNDGKKDAYNPLAGIVRGNATVNIAGGQVVHNVYGAGAMGSVGTASDANSGKTTINITGGRIGHDGDGNGHVFGAARGEFGISTAKSGLANVRETEVNINYTATPDSDNGEKNEQLIAGSVFGGGEAGTVKENVAVNMTGGLILKDVYGGGALADTQTSNWNNNTWATGKTSANSTTTVRLTGGTISGEAYGGGLGEAGKPAYVYGDVLLDLNGTTSSGETGTAIAKTARGCAVHEVFGCNNVNGTPKGNVMVHIYATQNKDKTQVANTNGETPVTDAKRKNYYDVTAVYGGGNLAAYEPASAFSENETTKANARTNVIIDGCGLTSIKTVYGGGNAASTPATNVTVNGTFEIEELFGGGNGKDDLPNGDPNPGANVGFYAYADNATDAQTPADRAEHYGYGSGQASVNVFGGTIHRVFGGSNTKGNVRQTAVTLLDENSGCDFRVEEAYGGGKSAPMDAEAKLLMACIPGLNAAYGGAEAAAIQGNVTLNITNGTFDRVFGGNNLSGTINGSITVNIEEIGCKPIIIGELYGGGNQAGYSVFGYDNNDQPIEEGTTPKYNDPQVNVKSFTSIGNVYGGGYGSGATMVGNPTVNVSVVEGAWKDYIYKGQTLTIVDTNGTTTTTHDVELPNHEKGKIGAINNVFGGGNAAKVIGNTNVNIGTLAKVTIREYKEKTVSQGASVEGLYTRTGGGTVESPYRYTAATGNAVEGTTYYEEKNVEKDVVGVDIRENVYGGGNNAEVTGNTNVTIGKKEN